MGDKEKVFNEYAKDWRYYLELGLIHGQANGSFGTDLLNKFDLFISNYKSEVLKLAEEA